MQRVGDLHLGLSTFAAGKELEDFQSTIQSRNSYKFLLGLTPNYILEMCSRTSYTRPEFEMAIRNAADYDLVDLSSKWHEMIWRARDMVKLLPPSEVGKAVMAKGGGLFKGDAAALEAALSAGELEFHEGTLGGAWPRIIG